MTERRAMAAERDSTDRYVAAFMEDRVGAIFDARITGVTRFGLFVRLTETGAEGLLPDRARWAANISATTRRSHALIGDRTGTVYKLGDIVDGEAGRGRAADRRPALRSCGSVNARAQAAHASGREPCTTALAIASRRKR